MLLAAPVAALSLAGPATAATVVPLGTAANFALLAGSTIANTGVTTISGDIGLCCTGTAVTGFGPGGANQVVQPAGAFSASLGSGPSFDGQNDLDIAYTAVPSRQ